MLNLLDAIFNQHKQAKLPRGTLAITFPASLIKFSVKNISAQQVP